MRVCLIGNGNAAKFHIEAFTSEGCDPVGKIEDADIVSIATTDDSHAQYAIEAIGRSKHVLIEKPPTHSVEEWMAIKLALADHPEVQFACNLPLPFHPPFLDLKRKIKGEQFGDIYLIEGEYNYGRRWKLENGWRGQMPGYSVLLGGGLHLLDLMLWLRGRDVIDGCAFGTNTLESFKNHETVQSMFRFDDGHMGRLTANFGYNGEHVHRLAVWGTKDRIVIENKDEVDKTKVIRHFVSNLKAKEPVSNRRLFHAMDVIFRLEKSAHESA